MCGFIKMSVHPELMLPNDLKRLLRSKPCYVLLDGKVYYVDEYLECDELPLLYGDVSELEAIFPTSFGEVQSASIDHLTKLSRLTGHTRKKKRKSYLWDKAVHYFGICSEAANIGIVLEIIGRWWPALMLVGGGFFSLLVFISDPAIYFFKSLIRLTRIIGREGFGIQFTEEKNGVHRWQTWADILSLTLFSLTIPLFLGLIVSGPIGVILAWVFGLSALCIVGYFDYNHQKNRAYIQFMDCHKVFANDLDAFEKANDDDREEKYQAMLQSRQLKDEAYADYQTKRNSNRLYMGLLIGLAFLLICGSLAALVPPAIAPILLIVSKIASAYLVAIAVGRFSNWIRHKKVSTGSTPKILLALDASNSPSNEAERPAPSFPMTQAAVRQVIEQYKNYKTKHFFSRTSDASRCLVQSLKASVQDENKTDAYRTSLVCTYLNDVKNQGRALYTIVSKSLEDNYHSAGPSLS